MSTPYTVPFGRNLAHDPKPVATTNFSIPVGSSTVQFVTDRSYVGDGSVLVTMPAENTQVWWAAGPDWDSDFAAIPEGSTIHASYHLSGPVSGLLQQIAIRYTDGSALYGPGTEVNVSGTSFERQFPTPITVEAGKVVRNIYIIWNDNNGNTFYVGGLDIRVDQVPDAYIDGDSGANYIWEGTANDSPSRRLAFTPPVGKGGSIYPSVRLEVVNRQGIFKRDITSHFVDGSINYDLDAEQWKGSCNLTLDDPDLIQAFADEYVKIYLRVDYPDGTSEEGPVGMFMVDAPQERWQGGHDRWLYQGKDMLGLLATHMLRGVAVHLEFGGEEEITISPGFGVSGNRTYQKAVDDLLQLSAGFSPSQYSFSGGLMQPIGPDLAWESGTSILTILTELLQGAGWQKPWVTPHGIVTSSPAGINPDSVTPSVTFATGEGSKVRWPFEVDPDASKIGNRVRVTSAQNFTVEQPWSKPNPDFNPPGVSKKNKKKKKKTKRKLRQYLATVPSELHGVDFIPRRRAIVAWATNEDPSHPLSFQRLGRWLDLPDISIPVLSGQLEAQNLARQALIDAGNLPIRARLVTEVHLRGLNEVYRLDLKDHLGNPIPSGQGRYWCRGWSLQLGPPWEMVHTLTRVIPFQARSFS